MACSWRVPYNLNLSHPITPWSEGASEIFSGYGVMHGVIQFFKVEKSMDRPLLPVSPVVAACTVLTDLVSALTNWSCKLPSLINEGSIQDFFFLVETLRAGLLNAQLHFLLVRHHLMHHQIVN